MFKLRVPSLLTALLFTVPFCGTTHADVVEVPEMENQRRVGVIYKMSVTPARESVPAFKYRLTVEPHKTIPGNAVTHYLRSLGENSLNRPWETAQNEFGMEVYDWSSLKTKVEDIPLDKLKTVAGYFDFYVENHLRRATLCRDCEWGLAIEDLSEREIIEFPLPSVQQTRSMARALLLRNRLAVIEGRYDDSVDHLRMTYQLGQNVGKLRFLVANLVGIAEVRMANQGMVHLMAAKDSPNMYWALAELRRPIVSVRESQRLESSFPLRYCPQLIGVEDADYSKEKWREMLAELMDSLQYARTTSGQIRLGDKDNLAFAAALAGFASAKQRLIESGMDAQAVNQMPVAQVILIDAARDCRGFSQDIEKSYYLPFEKAGEFVRTVETQLRESAPTRLGALIVDQLASATAQVRQAEVRAQAQIDILMAIESIRNHIAVHGDLPKSLDELELPVRDNPFTGKPFNYMFKGETAVLSLPRERGMPWSIQYEISINKPSMEDNQ